MSQLPSIQNVVTTLTSGANLHLPTLVQRLSGTYGCEYNPRRFAAITVRIRESNNSHALTATALFFRSGKIVCTGARSVALSRWALIQFVKIIRSIGFPVSMRGYEVQNMVANTSIGKQIDLRRMAATHTLNCNYEPEQFPGLVFRVQGSRQVCLLFESGQIVITGAKKHVHVMRAFKAVYPIIMNFVSEQPMRRLQTVDMEMCSDFESDDECGDDNIL